MVKTGIKTFVIVVDKPQPIFIPGEVVSGQCVIQLDGQMHLSQLYIKLIGKAECNWTETEHRTERGTDGKNRSTTHQRTIHSCHKCLNLMYYPGNGEQFH